MYQEFQVNEIDLVLGCSENRDTSRGLASRLGLTMPYAYGLDAEELSRLIGCYYDAKEKYIQSTGFIINPDGEVLVGAYSTGVVGRIRADDALSVIRYYQTEDAGFLPQI